MPSPSRSSSSQDGMGNDADSTLDLAMFQEPADYTPKPSPPSKLIKYPLLSGRTLNLRLVGHNPLWGHHLWQGATSLSTYLQHHPHHIHSKTILELGAGAALPGILCATDLAAARVLITDYPDPELVDNMARNIRENCSSSSPSSGGRGVVAERGYLWGADVAPLLAELPAEEDEDGGEKGFDVLILADVVFNHSCHEALVSTILGTMRRREGSAAYVFFTPYRPWLLERDLAFLGKCEESGMLRVEKVWEERMERVMFEGDRG